MAIRNMSVWRRINSNRNLYLKSVKVFQRIVSSLSFSRLRSLSLLLFHICQCAESFGIMFQSLCVGGLTLAKMNISPCFPKPINLFIQGTTKKLLCRCNDTGIWMNRWTRVQIKCQKFSEPQNVCVCVGGREEWESEYQKCTFTETESHCYHIGQHISICGIVIFYFNCNNKLCQALFMRAYVCIHWMEVERGMILVVCLDDVHIMLYMLLRMCLFTLVNVANFLIFAVRCVLHWEIVMWCVILFFFPWFCMQFALHQSEQTLEYGGAFGIFVVGSTDSKYALVTMHNFFCIQFHSGAYETWDSEKYINNTCENTVHGSLFNAYY